MEKYAIKVVLLTVFYFFADYSLMAQSIIFKKQDSCQTLSEIWELDSNTTKETFLLTAYKPVYILPFRFSSHRRSVPFEIPTEVSPGIATAEVPTDRASQLDNYEATIQLSFKTKIAQKIFGNGAVWLAYTQKSYWQVYNVQLSRPFRETNYEPEIIFNYPIASNFLGLKTKMIGFSFNHQSNGREGIEFSRSWNRFIVHVSFEENNWSLLVRTWVTTTASENKDIKNFMGRGDAIFNYRMERYLLTLKAQHSLRGGSNNRGSVELDFAFPIYGNLKGYGQFFHGYGDAMIDYNQRHTIGGIGIVFEGTL